MTVVSRDPTSVVSEIEFPNAIPGPEKDPASPMPVESELPDDRRTEPLNDYVDRIQFEREQRQFLREKEYPEGTKIHDVPEVPYDERRDRKIADYSHLVPQEVPDYSHLAPPEEDHPADKESPAPDLIKHATSIIQGMYDDIKKFSENPTPENAAKIAIQIVGGGIAAGPERGALGIAGGKPPYFRPGANDNTPLRTPEVNPVTEAELMTSAAFMQRIQQQTQKLRQEAIKSGTIAEKGSLTKEMESTLKRLKLDREAHETAGVLSKGDLRELDKEIASVEEMLSVIKAKNPGSVVPIDIKEMQATKPQEPQAADLRVIKGGLEKREELFNELNSILQKAKNEGRNLTESELNRGKEIHVEINKLIKDYNKALSEKTPTQEPQSRHYEAKGVHISHEDKEIIRELNDKGNDAFQIAKKMTALREVRKTPNPEMSEEKIKRYIKSMGLITPETKRLNAIRDEVKAQDVELLGKVRSHEEVYQAVKEKFPGVKKDAITNVLDRVRAQRRNDALSAEKYGVNLNPEKEMAQQQKTGESIFKPVGQGEFDFNAPAKVTYPVPSLEEAKREMLFARDTYAKFKGSILDLEAASAQTLEEMRLRSVLAARTKDLHATVAQMEKDKKSGDLLGRHAQEYMAARVQAMQEFIADAKAKIWGPNGGIVYSARDAELRAAIMKEAPSNVVRDKNGKLIEGKYSDPYKEPTDLGAARTPPELIHYRESVPREGAVRAGTDNPNKGKGYQMGMTVGGVKLGQLQVSRMQEMIDKGDTAAEIVRKFKERHGINLKRLSVEQAMDRLK